MDKLPASAPVWLVVILVVLIAVIVPIANGPAVVEWVKGRFGKKDTPAVEAPKPAVLEQGAAALTGGDFVQGRLLAEQGETAELKQANDRLRDRIEQLLEQLGEARAVIARLRVLVRFLGGDPDDDG